MLISALYLRCSSPVKISSRETIFMIRVHHLKQSRSTRVIWLLEELNAKYEVVEYERDKNTKLAPAEFRAIHPLGKSPIIEHNEIVLTESGAIIEYCLMLHDHDLIPKVGSTEYVRYLEWMHFAEGSLGLPIISTLLMQMEERGGKPMDFYIGKELKVDFGYIDQFLSDNVYFCGELFSAADVMMTVSLDMADNLKLLEGYSHIERYLTNIRSRPCYQKARGYA